LLFVICVEATYVSPVDTQQADASAVRCVCR